ncbi:aldo/keto reductase [Haliangium ochraceum]|uniref:Aldo/keto reductase n=1 Tax=Haliangium ochraceum (strain DSM 14365 / JCM 11303 / SMP-2) TaxID=502025 RepID=D0LM86_HALO1|nr:aldo/keto reductase [Haliangium ochraceum]ACY16792.1 aldo/keto reductase [Haliangium ochraceum DSM 14365]
MKTRPLGPSGIEASVIALGAWAIGGWMWGGADENDAIRTIHAAIDAGVNFIDTAAVYGFGASEELVGKAIAERRGEVVLATKCGMVWNTDKGKHAFDSEGKSIYRYLAASSIREEVELSLRRLGVETIDLYQTHWQDPTTPIAETMETLLALKQAGKIRAIGVSNASVEQMNEYMSAGQLDADQESYSMLDRKLDAEQLPYCAKHGIAVLAYSPMARGLLTGKVTPERSFPEGDHRATHPLFSVDNRKQVQALLERCQPVAERHGITLAQLSVAWALHQGGMTHALVGARTPEQAIENAKAGTVELNEDDLATMADALSAYQPPQKS